MVIEGVVSIAEGENSRNIQTKLQGFVNNKEAAAKKNK